MLIVVVAVTSLFLECPPLFTVIGTYKEPGIVEGIQNAALTSLQWYKRIRTVKVHMPLPTFRKRVPPTPDMTP